MQLFNQIHFLENNMRILTKIEKELFDIAYKHISALSAMQNEHTELYMLRHGHDGNTPMPAPYFTLCEDIGGFEQLRGRFCLMNRVPATQYLIQFCFDHRIQPSAFEIVGTIRKMHVERINYAEKTYTMEG